MVGAVEVWMGGDPAPETAWELGSVRGRVWCVAGLIGLQMRSCAHAVEDEYVLGFLDAIAVHLAFRNRSHCCQIFTVSCSSFE